MNDMRGFVVVPPSRIPATSVSDLRGLTTSKPPPASITNEIGGFLGIDPYFAYVALLFDFQGPPNAPVTFSRDRSRNNFTIVDGNSITAALRNVDPRFLDTSWDCYDASQTCYFKIANSPLLRFGTGDFTVEIWRKDSRLDRNIFCALDDQSTGGSDGRWMWTNAGTASTQIAVYFNGSLSIGFNEGSLLIDGLWHHYAWDRYKGVSTLFVDGLNNGSAVDGNNYASSQLFTVGAGNNGSFGHAWLGGIGAFRMTNGLSRYRGNEFAVPKSAFPTS